MLEVILKAKNLSEVKNNSDEEGKNLLSVAQREGAARTCASIGSWTAVKLGDYIGEMLPILKI